MKLTQSIEEAAVLCSVYKECTFVITQDNKYTLFMFAYYQAKYKTLNSFKNISYQKSKDALYYFLKLFSIISLNYYKLTYDYESQNK